MGRHFEVRAAAMAATAKAKSAIYMRASKELLKNIVNLAQEMSLNVLLKKQKAEMQPPISLVAMNSLDQAEAISLSIL